MSFSSLLSRFNQEQSGVPAVLRETGDAIAREAHKDRAIGILSEQLREFQMADRLRIVEERSREDELLSAMRMAGAGPWQMPDQRAIESARSSDVTARESPSSPLFNSQGAFGDIELALQSIEWRREVNFSWLEFSRWGIQQIILISRLYFVKNPMIQRGINVSALYVFGRGVSVSADQPEADVVLQAFFERNKRTLGQNALMDLERRKYYDGNLFFVFFSDAMNTGEVNVRTIDATEIQEIVCDPDDSDKPQFYLRTWTQQSFNDANAQFSNETKRAWYPALGYDPTDKPQTIGSYPVLWDNPVYHRKVGGIGKWRYGCPLVYAALDWAKAVREFLEACMTVRQALAQFAMILKTKGGQQAMQGAKQQLSTTVGPSASLWDQNPPAVMGSIFTSGMGTELTAFNTRGAGGDPDDVRQYKLMVAMVFGLPESFFGDMNTSNLATATSLDRPTELMFTAKQEEWSEDLVVISSYVLAKSARAPSGQLREASKEKEITVRECRWSRDKRGRKVYEVDQPQAGVVKIKAAFPTIIEADTPEQVKAVVDAMTLGSATGEVRGIDEKEGVRLLYAILGVQNPDELLEEQYPSSGPDEYDPLRTGEEPEAAAGTVDPNNPAPKTPAGAMREAVRRFGAALRRLEESRRTRE